MFLSGQLRRLLVSDRVHFLPIWFLPFVGGLRALLLQLHQLQQQPLLHLQHWLLPIGNNLPALRWELLILPVFG